MQKIITSFLTLALIALLSACSSSGGKDGGFNDMPFDKMIVTANANYWKVPPGGGSMPDGVFHRGERVRIVGQAGGYLEIQNTRGKTFMSNPPRSVTSLVTRFNPA